MRCNMVKKISLNNRYAGYSAPGNVFLFGEHAVVYGEPALVTTVNLRTSVKAKILDSSSKFRIDSEGIGKLKGVVDNNNNGSSLCKLRGDKKELEYVKKAVEYTFNHIGNGKGFRISINSDIPPSSGFGSSSAVTTATIATIAKAMGSPLEKTEISELAFEVEKAIQGLASRAGVKAAVQGGYLRVEGDKSESLILPAMDVLVGFTGKPSNTTAQVQFVKKQKEKHPKMINPIFESIGKVSEAGIESLKNEYLRRTGKLMNSNQELLESLGVSTPEIRKSIRATKSAGALGSKLSGGGGGGSIISLYPDLLDGECMEGFSTRIGGDGLKPIKNKESEKG